MVYDITFIYEQTLYLYTVELADWFFRSSQYFAIMAASKKCLFEAEIEQSLLDELTASDQSSYSDESDSSGIEDLTVCKVICVECSDNESEEVKFATAPSALSASSAIFTWEDMTNYVGQREQFVDNYGPQNETHCAKVFKMFFD
jgi:hypothetical protein